MSVGFNIGVGLAISCATCERPYKFDALKALGVESQRKLPPREPRMTEREVTTRKPCECGGRVFLVQLVFG